LKAEWLTPFPSGIHLQVSDIFIVRYASADGDQNTLPSHTDGCKYSFNMLLSEETSFEGGGTYFDVVDRTLKPKQGEILIHRGDLRHAGMPVTAGTRYILVGFVNVKQNQDAAGAEVILDQDAEEATAAGEVEEGASAALKAEADEVGPKGVKA